MLPNLENMSPEDAYVVSNYWKSEAFLEDHSFAVTDTTRSVPLQTGVWSSSLNTASSNTLNSASNNGRKSVTQNSTLRISTDFYIHFDPNADMIWEGELHQDAAHIGDLKLEFHQKETNEQRACVFHLDPVREWLSDKVKLHHLSMKVGGNYYRLCGKKTTKINTIICGTGCVVKSNHRSNKRLNSTKKVTIDLRIKKTSSPNQIWNQFQKTV